MQWQSNPTNSSAVVVISYCLTVVLLRSRVDKARETIPTGAASDRCFTCQERICQIAFARFTTFRLRSEVGCFPMRLVRISIAISKSWNNSINKNISSRDSPIFLVFVPCSRSHMNRRKMQDVVPLNWLSSMNFTVIFRRWILCIIAKRIDGGRSS